MNLDHSTFSNVYETKSADDAADTDAIITKALEDFQSAFEAKMAAAEKKAADRLDKLETKLNRPAVHTDTDKPEATIETKAFNRFLRRGEAGMSPDEQKAMTVANDASGGYLAPEALASQIITKLVEFSPIRAYASVITIGAESIKLPVQTGNVSAFWVDETAERTATQPAFGQLSLKPWELAAYTDISVQLLEDNAYNLEGFLVNDFAEQFGKTESLAFVKGTGLGQPTGLMNSLGINEVKTGAATGFKTSNQIDTLTDMVTALPAAYFNSAVWVMNAKTLGEIRKWKDGNGYPFVLNPVSGGFSQLLGRPIVIAPDMEDIGAGKAPIVLGDLSGYQIVDRVGFSTLRDPYTLATKGQVRINARKRVGGDVTRPDRFVKLRIGS
ncbi:phage major capsid protein [Aureimonas psammosilenae]|uniref:phage major capsid protein n=1 Tax=Aureimonas psammosilenae TaxID=2495496 RepID=UPI0012609C9F|nr:phage major capsid protein [Aureimonas psammosilenae]